MAHGLAVAGTRVLCVSRTETCAAVARSIKERGGLAEALPLDISDVDRCEQTVSELIRRLQPERIGVVLAAAVLGAPGGLLHGPPLGQWQDLYRTNVLGNLAVLKACLPHMLATRFGRVIALAGGGSGYEYPEFSAYALTKVAMVRAMENLAVELSDAGDFSFVALAPGAIDTDMLQQVKAGGGVVLTPASIEEPVHFAAAFFTKDPRPLSGRFLHVRDDWASHMADGGPELSADQFKLRRAK